MKMVVLMCVEQHVEKARKILKDINVKSYSESEMLGFKNNQDDESDNWFAQKHAPINSHILFTMVDAEEAQKILDSVDKNNQDKNSLIHAFQLNVEKAIY